MIASQVATASRLLLKGQAYGLCAHLLSPDVRLWARGTALEEFRAVLTQLGYSKALSRLEEIKRAVRFDPPLQEREYVRLFVKGEAPPYETSYAASRSTLGGKTHQLADIAGFYRAFGFRVSGERPDHLVPELEFVALLYVKEAYARMSGSDDGAALCADTRSKFMDQHLLTWLSAFHEQVGRAAKHPAYPILGALLLDLVHEDQEEATEKGLKR